MASLYRRVRNRFESQNAVIPAQSRTPVRKGGTPKTYSFEPAKHAPAYTPPPSPTVHTSSRGPLRDPSKPASLGNAPKGNTQRYVSESARRELLSDPRYTRAGRPYQEQREVRHQALRNRAATRLKDLPKPLRHIAHRSVVGYAHPEKPVTPAVNPSTPWQKPQLLRASSVGIARAQRSSAVGTLQGNLRSAAGSAGLGKLAAQARGSISMGLAAGPLSAAHEALNMRQTRAQSNQTVRELRGARQAKLPGVRRRNSWE